MASNLGGLMRKNKRKIKACMTEYLKSESPSSLRGLVGLIKTQDVLEEEWLRSLKSL